jgi:hypothetical protein
MNKAPKASNQFGFLVRRKLRLKGLSEVQWVELMSELDHHPCVDYVERKSPETISVTLDASHWFTDDFLALLRESGRGHWFWALVMAVVVESLMAVMTRNWLLMFQGKGDAL